MPYPQDTLGIAVNTPFGADALLLVDLHGEERISGLFRFELELISTDNALDFKTIIGKGVTLTVRGMAKEKPRFIHGLCTRFVQAGRVGKQTRYRAELRPWLWMLGKTSDCRIFQEKSATDIIKEIFQDNGFSSGENFKESLKGTYKPRPYCVQYQETALDFVSRLMEDEGIYYYFVHEDGKHVMVLADDSASATPCPNLEKARFVEQVSTSMDEEAIVECTIEEEVVAGKYAATDYNFEMPSTSLLAQVAGKAAKLELFEYPGGHIEKDPGDARAKLRIEAEESCAVRFSGTSHIRAFVTGHAFKLEEHDRADANIEYVLESVVHQGNQETYQNTFSAFPKETPYRPSRLTSKPAVYGTQTALVVGKSGEEIWTDEYGRIKVQFHWDRKGKKDDQSSCFVRVAQPWAGKTWGAWFLPRMGQEVVVSFIDGDPDRPLVTGSVYNADQPVPYTLPDHQTKSTLLSRSSKEGDAGNELRFEDKKDSEEWYAHAQKDMLFEVENDWTVKVLHDYTKNVKNERKVTIEEGNETLTVTKGNRTVNVDKGDETHTVKGKRTLTVHKDEAHASKANLDFKVTKNYTIKVDGDLVIEAKSVTIKAQQAFTMKAGTDFKADAGTAMTLKAGTDFTAKGGVNMNLEGGVGLKAKGGAQAAVEGGGMLTLKGGMVKIN
jgi:type VI secretion system secreted protein VgrG